jgi:hypothetical protein
MGKEEMTDAEIMSLPKKTANRAEVDAYYYLAAAQRTLARAERDMEKRIRMLPNGWRDFRLVQSRMGDLVRMIGGTFEPEKARQIARMGQTVQLKLEFNRQAVREKEMMLIETEEACALITAAQEACKLRMCDPQECRKCELGRVMDRLSWLSRGNRAWWEVFGVMGTKKEIEEGKNYEEEEACRT